MLQVKEKLGQSVERAQWFTFEPAMVVPLLASVQRTMGVPLDSRNEDEPVAKNWGLACGIYQKLVKPSGAILSVSNIPLMSEKLFAGSENSILYERFVSSKKAYLFLSTIGSFVEEEAARMFSQGEYLMGGILDAIASEGVEVVVDLLQEKAAMELKSSCVRFSPGYGQWGLSVQPFFVEMLEGANKGISLNDSHLFTPHKTVSGVIIPGGSSDSSPCDVCDTSCCKQKS
jgi:hypothetical protein